VSDRRNHQSKKEREARLVVAALAAIAALLLFLILLIPNPTKRTASTSAPAKPDASASGETPNGGAGSGQAEPETGAHGSEDGTVSTSLSVKPSPREVPKRLYLVIDDVGNNLFQLRPFLDFPGPITFAVLPQLEYSGQAATLAHKAGKEVILHLPMQADNPAINPGPGAITTNLGDQAIVNRLRKDISTVPFLIGVNNHEGSRATSDARVMRVVLEELKQQGLFFLDSRTTADSVARPIAEQLGLPFAQREVFLDNNQSRAAILTAFSGAEKIAAERGYAVMIGHVWTDALAGIIKELYPRLLADGFVFGKLSDLVAEKGGAIARGPDSPTRQN